jgi:uncharacterized membrane protein YebE (DUF533 family)
MTKMNNRWIALGVAGAIGATPLFGLAPHAQANSKTKKYLMYGAAAATGYGLLTHRRTLAVAGAAGTYLAYRSYRKDKKKEARRQAWYRQRYGSNWRLHYHPGA